MAKRNFKKSVRIKVTHPGKLGGPGYLKKSAAARHKLLAKCVKGYGYKSCLGSIQALSVWLKNVGTAEEKSKLVQDREWLVRTYGAGSKKKRKRNAGCAKIGPALRNMPTAQPQRAFSGGYTSAQVIRNFNRIEEDLL